MAKTYADILSEARVLLQDREVPYRYDDATLLDPLNRALNELGRVRPDAFTDRYRRNALNIPEVIASGEPEEGQVLLTGEFDLERQFYNPLVAYVVALIELADDEYSNDGRAVALLQQFRNTLIGV